MEQAALYTTVYTRCMADFAHLSLMSSLLILPVLPKFEVKVEGPKYLTRDDDHIEGEVSAEYVHRLVHFVVTKYRRHINCVI